MSHQLPDTQSSEPTVSIGLERVGITNVQKLVKIAREAARPLVLTAEFEVFVDLPGWRKGADMSRNMEAIDEVLEDVLREPSHSVDSVCTEAASRLFEKHEYTNEVSVEMNAEYVTKTETPASERSTQGTVDVIAGAVTDEDGTTERIGVTSTGMTVCPCSQGMSTQRARDTLDDLGVRRETIDKFLEAVPQPGHSQRGHATVILEGSSLDVDFRDLIDIGKESMSARIYNLAKRPDEDHMTYESHADAKFVEDCVRSMAEAVVETYPSLPDDVVVTMKQSNDESIHQHNAHAERRARLGELRRELD